LDMTCPGVEHVYSNLRVTIICSPSVNRFCPKESSEEFPYFKDVIVRRSFPFVQVLIRDTTHSVCNQPWFICEDALEEVEDSLTVDDVSRQFRNRHVSVPHPSNTIVIIDLSLGQLSWGHLQRIWTLNLMSLE